LEVFRFFVASNGIKKRNGLLTTYFEIRRNPVATNTGLLFSPHHLSVKFNFKAKEADAAYSSFEYEKTHLLSCANYIHPASAQPGNPPG
jgi:hypothetical protein